MADHIPFITSDAAADLVKRLYADSAFIRVPLDKADKVLTRRHARTKVWLDPCVDGMHDLESRRSTEERRNTWFESMKGFPNFAKIATPPHDAKVEDVHAFVKAVMGRCVAHKPAWITVPQLPLVDGSERNRINLRLAETTGRWKRRCGFPGHLILPLVFTHQRQVKGKTERRPQVRLAKKRYDVAQADGFWVVESSLDDETGARPLRSRFSSIIALHEELNAAILSKIRIAGPYWGLNLVLWARNLVDYPAIGIGSSYQYLLAGGHVRTGRDRLMLASLRRRVGMRPQLRGWLGDAAGRLAASHPAHVEFREIKNHYAALTGKDAARAQVARLYKQWFDTIAATPRAGRSIALFQDLSAAFALGRSLPDLHEAGQARKPEAVAEPLMLNSL